MRKKIFTCAPQFSPTMILSIYIIYMYTHTHTHIYIYTHTRILYIYAAQMVIEEGLGVECQDVRRGREIRAETDRNGWKESGEGFLLVCFCFVFSLRRHRLKQI